MGHWWPRVGWGLQGALKRVQRKQALWAVGREREREELVGLKKWEV